MSFPEVTSARPRGIGTMCGLALVCVGAAFFGADPDLDAAFLAAAVAFATIAIGWAAYNETLAKRARRQTDAHIDAIEFDPALCFLCAADGRLIYANLAARHRFHIGSDVSLSSVLETVFASSEGIVYRLQQKALSAGAATEHVTSHADGFQVFVRVLKGGHHLWRLVTLAQPSATKTDKRAPAVLTLGRNNAVLFMNPAARALIGRRVKRLEDIISDLPLRSGAVYKLRGSDVEDSVLAHIVDGGAGRRELTLISIEKTELEASADPSGGFDTLPVPLLKVTADGTILRANGEARKLLHLDGVQLGNLADNMEGLGRALQDWLREAAQGRGPTRSEFLRLTRPDREVFVQVTLNRVVEEGEPVLIAVLNDATELKTLEAQFVQSQKMQAIGQLAGGVAHDFNNLLTAISGHCDLMLLRHDQGDPDYGDLVQINQNANRAASLVGQLLAFSRKQSMRSEVMDLRDTLSDLTHLLNRLVGEKVQLRLSHDPLLAPVRGDRRQLEQVMMNLVVNARDAMPEGGVITIETERFLLNDPLERDRVVVPPGAYVAVRVTDQGIGIPPDKLQKVFEPFFTTKRTGDGTGLGLSTVYGIVKQTGGYIFVDSVVGSGTTFFMLFPEYCGEETIASAKPPDTTRRLPKKGSGVVLLVEDEAPVRAFAARALRLRGYTVVEAETAEAALEMLDDKDMVVDVFVTDVVMPGLDGPSWVRIAQKDRPDVRVVFVSGYAEEVFSNGSDEIPNSVFLPKPFSLSDLTETVHQQFS